MPVAAFIIDLWSSKTLPAYGTLGDVGPNRVGVASFSLCVSSLYAVCGILGSGEQTRIESCIIRIPESMVESHYSSPN
jgi:hypothetical protein